VPLLVLQETAIKLTRSLTAEEMGAVQDAAAKLDHEITADEAVAVIEALTEIPTLGGTSKAAVNAAPAAEEAAPPVEKWTKNASELGADLKAKIGTFAAMKPQINQVKYDFGSLKYCIESGKLPPTARIMPEYEWQKTHKKDGSKTTEHGFLHFEDFCQVVLKRTKQAVYAMLADCDPPAEPKPPETDPEKIKGALLKRGTASFLKLFQDGAVHEKSLTFNALMQRIVSNVTARYADELKQARERAKNVAAELASLEAIAGGVNHTTAKRVVEREILPPSQGQAR